MSSLNDNVNLIDLVKKAQSGCQESMDSLAKQAQPGIFTYIYRLTLNHDVSKDLQQETLLEMVKSLKKLNNPERFWAWLYRTALGKVQHYFRDRKYEKVIQSMSALEKEKILQSASGSRGDGLKNMINKELSQAVVDAMAKLKLRHRSILVLRCYEQLPYSEIAEIMDCSEMAAQILFFRAKHSLKRKLSKHGFGKGMLLGALGLFGQMTTPAEAAPVTVSAASTKVGVAATVIGAAGTKLGLTIAAMVTATALTIGSVTSLNNTDYLTGSKLPTRSEINSFHYTKHSVDKAVSSNTNLLAGQSLSRGAYEQWYYFPDGIDGPMFNMTQRWEPQQKVKQCGWLQNGSGSYYYHSGRKTIYLDNLKWPRYKLKTNRLITDTPELTEFFDQVEGVSIEPDYTIDPETGLLTGMKDDRFYNVQNFESSIIYNGLDSKSFDSFVYPWPKDAPIIDGRDEMHKRGWTYFQINGEINGQQVQGYGQIPFIYNTLAEHPPWLILNIGSNLKIIDGPLQTYLCSANGEVISAYPAGSFMKGLPRPWMGMNTIDIIRRDAAEKRIKFSTENFGGDDDHYGKAEIVLFGQANHNQIQIVYTVDIDKDVIEKIEFLANGDAENNVQGVLEFTYLQDIDQVAGEFTEPAKIRVRKNKYKESMGMLWLMELAQGTLGK